MSDASPPLGPDVLDRYLAGECSPEERAAVGRVRAGDPAFASFLDALDAAHVAREDRAAARWDQQAFERNLGERIEAGERLSAPQLAMQVAPPRSRRSPILAAAALLVAVGLTLRIAAWVRAPSPSGTRVYATGTGERATVRLVDGTQVTLAPASTLRVPIDYTNGHRAVALEGEALFTVVHDAAHSFSVQVRSAVATDVGTQFDVRAYQDDGAVRVAVTEGEVRVETGRRRLLATRGDLSTISDSALAITHNADVTTLTSWATGVLAYNGAPLPDVLADLARWYGVSVRLGDRTLGARRIAATFPPAATLESVLSSLAPTVGARVTRDGTGYVLLSIPHSDSQ